MQISKKELLTGRSLARVACRACEGCGDCCRNMGDSIRLDPYDFWQLEKGLSLSARDLARTYLGFVKADGLLLPCIKMKEGACPFLELGRCRIHSFRPGICRLFPLGRQYDAVGLRYFVIPDGCDMPGKSKVRIEDYLEIENLSRYEAYLAEYHRLLGRVQGLLKEEYWQKMGLGPDFRTTFFLLDYDVDRDFSSQFIRREEDFIRRNRLPSLMGGRD
jgi:Fe-S-cluster containining protein